MSVLKVKRNVSKAEYINTAYNIFVYVVHFLSRLSNRYVRLIGDKTAELAYDLVTEVEIANSIYPNDEFKLRHRVYHLQEARGKLMALDVGMLSCYKILSLNPQGAFTDSKGNTVDSREAVDKIDKMSQSLGELIDFENTLLTGLIKNSKVISHGKSGKKSNSVKPDNQASGINVQNASTNSVGVKDDSASFSMQDLQDIVEFEDYILSMNNKSKQDNI